MMRVSTFNEPQIILSIGGTFWDNLGQYKCNRLCKKSSLIVNNLIIYLVFFEKLMIFKKLVILYFFKYYIYLYYLMLKYFMNCYVCMFVFSREYQRF